MSAKPNHLCNVWDVLRSFALPVDPVVKNYKLWVGCPFAEDDHKKDPRVFAHTNCQKNTVCASPRLLHLPLPVQAGILAHELGHLLAYHWWKDWREEAADGVVFTYLGGQIEYKPPLYLQELKGPVFRRLKDALP